jgi:dihydrodipicolinate synthase/N-acetylneuraminate lyase
LFASSIREQCGLRSGETPSVDFGSFEGIVVPLFRPLDEQERIIERDLRDLTRHLLGRGVAGLLAPSGTGEFFNLSAEERHRSVAIVADEVHGRVPAIAIAGPCRGRHLGRADA